MVTPVLIELGNSIIPQDAHVSLSPLKMAKVQVTTITLIGLLSTAVSLRQCERCVASWLQRDVMKGEPFDVFASNNEWVIKTFRKVGANVRPKDTVGEYSADYRYANLEHAQILKN